MLQGVTVFLAFRSQGRGRGFACLRGAPDVVSGNYRRPSARGLFVCPFSKPRSFDKSITFPLKLAGMELFAALCVCVCVRARP